MMMDAKLNFKGHVEYIWDACMALERMKPKSFDLFVGCL